MNTLFIDTSDNKEITVGLYVDEEKYFIQKKLERQKSQVVLALILTLLQKHKISLQEITSLEVNPGPGSFTGIRVGVAVANALSYALHIPLNHGTKFIEPVYS